MDPRTEPDMNRNDPRVSRDSGYNTQHHSGHSNQSTKTGYGTSNITSGPHNSNLLNKADPRVESDNSRGYYENPTGTYDSSAGDYGSGHTGGPAYGNTASTTAGPHGSNLANKADPRVDSDRSRGAYGNTTNSHNPLNPGAGHSTGHGDTTTAGPHSSSMMNKLDPRVDSDVDGSRNVGMGNNRNMGASNTGTIPPDVSSHGHATGAPAGALEGRHAKHTSGPHKSLTILHSIIIFCPIKLILCALQVTSQMQPPAQLYPAGWFQKVMPRQVVLHLPMRAQPRQPPEE